MSLIKPLPCTGQFGKRGHIDHWQGATFAFVAVSTRKFTYDGREVIGISTMAPIFETIKGARAGESAELNGRKLVIEDVA